MGGVLLVWIFCVLVCLGLSLDCPGIVCSCIVSYCFCFGSKYAMVKVAAPYFFFIVFFLLLVFLYCCVRVGSIYLCFGSLSRMGVVVFGFYIGFVASRSRACYLCFIFSFFCTVIESRSRACYFYFIIYFLYVFPPLPLAHTTLAFPILLCT